MVKLSRLTDGVLWAAFVVVPIAAALAGGPPAAATPPATGPSTRPAAAIEAPPITVAVVLDQADAKAGGQLPFSIEFTNRTDRPVTVMVPIDGCDFGWRQATYAWSVTTATGEPVARRAVARCGNTNPIAAADFVTVPANGKTKVAASFLRSPTQFADAGPGEYKATLTYSFDPAKPNTKGEPMGKDASEVPELVKKAWAGTVVSEAVTFKVVP